MRDVGVLANRIPQRRAASFLRHAELGPWTVNDPRQVFGLLRLEEVEKRVVLHVLEALVRDPQLRAGEIGPQQGAQILEESHDVQRVVVARVAAGHEDRVEPRQLLVQRLVRRQFGRRAARKHALHRRPETIIHVVIRANIAHIDVHLRHCGREMRADVLRENPFDGIGSENDKVADVLFIGRLVPRVVGVRRIPVAELVPAQRVGWRGGHVGRPRENRAGRAPFQGTQQRPSAEQRPPRPVAKHPDDLPRSRVLCEKRIPLGVPSGSAPNGRNRNNRPRRGHLGGRGPRQSSPLLNLLDQNHGCLRLRFGWNSRVHDHCRRAQVDVPAGKRGGIGYVDEALFGERVVGPAHGHPQRNVTASRARICVRGTLKRAGPAVSELPVPARDGTAAHGRRIREGHFE